MIMQGDLPGSLITLITRMIVETVIVTDTNIYIVIVNKTIMTTVIIR